MKNILVGIDFNEKTEVLIEKAKEFAEKFKAKLWLLHAVAPMPEFVGIDVSTHYTVKGQENVLENERKILAGYATHLESEGFEAEDLLIEGATTDVLLEESKKLKVDLIICGHHEHNFLYNIFFGSVSASIMRRSDIPVLVFPIG